MALPAGYAVAVLATGFELQVTFPDWVPGGTYTLDPDGTPNVILTVTSEGFDNAGVATTIARVLYATDILRLPGTTTDSETASGSDTIVKFSLSDFIYDTDTYTITVQNAWAVDTAGGGETAEVWTDEAGTNSSTLTHPLPVANWAEPPLGLYANADFSVELAAFHGYPLDGKPVAAVKFTLSDGTNTDVRTETTPVLLTKFTDEHPVYGFRPTFDVSGLDDGAFTIRAQVYPWVGDAAAVLDTDNAIGTFPAFKGYLDAAGNYKICYASVTTGGNDGTGVASKTEATADASPYLTIGAALAGIKTVNNTLSAPDIQHDDTGRGRVKLGTGTFAPMGTVPGALEVTQAAVWAEVIDNSGASATPVLTASVNQPVGETKLIKYDGLTITEPTNKFAFYGPGTADSDIWWHNVDITDTNAYNVNRTEYNRWFLTQSTVTNTTLTFFSTFRGYLHLMRGCDFDDGGLTTTRNLYTVNLLGNTIRGNGITLRGSTTASHASVEGNDNVVIGFNNFPDLIGGATLLVTGDGSQSDMVNLAVVQNVFENMADASRPVMRLNDGNTAVVGVISNHIFAHNTVVGDRFNAYYNDANANIPNLNRLFFKYNIFEDIATKHDLFTGIDPADASRINAWSFLWGVGQQGNVIAEVGSNFPLEYYGLNGSGPTSSVSYTADNSEESTIPSNSDFTIATPGDEANRLPANDAGVGGRMFDRDFAGVLRRVDGTGNAGAYETPAAVSFTYTDPVPGAILSPVLEPVLAA